MKEVALFFGWAVLHLWLLWYAYILVMGLYRAHLDGRLTPLTKVMAYPALIAGYVLDWTANWTVAVIVFGELPHRPFELVTDRLTRYLKEPTRRFRRDRARWICENLLDFFDPRGSHCQ